MTEKGEKIISDYVTKLGTIATDQEYESGSNYETNIGASVVSWETKPFWDEDTDEVIVEDSEVEYDEEDEIHEAHYQERIIHNRIYYVNSSPVSGLKKRVNDILRCIGKWESYFLSTYGDCVFRPVSVEYEVRQSKKIIGAAHLVIACRYGTERFLIGETDYT